MDFWTLFEITVVPHLRIGFRSVSRVLCSAAEGFLNLLGLFCNKPGFKRTWNAKRALNSNSFRVLLKYGFQMGLNHFLSIFQKYNPKTKMCLGQENWDIEAQLLWWISPSSSLWWWWWLTRGQMAFIEGKSRTQGSKPTTISRPPEHFFISSSSSSQPSSSKPLSPQPSSSSSLLWDCLGLGEGALVSSKGEMDFCRGVIGKRDGRVYARWGIIIITAIIIDLQFITWW